MTATVGGTTGPLGAEEVDRFVRSALESVDLDGRSLCVVIPDATRRCPVAHLLQSVERAVRHRVRSCTTVIALGTHAPMSDRAITSMVGETRFPVVNHRWWSHDTFVPVGTLGADTVSELSEGRLDETIGVRINRLVVESDVTGKMPGRTGVSTPRSRRSAISPTYSASSKKNCVTPKSASSSLAAR